MPRRKRQYEELSDDSEVESDADTVILTDDEESETEKDDDRMQCILKYIDDTPLAEKICEDLKSGMTDDMLIEKYKNVYFEKFHRLISNARSIIHCFDWIDVGFNIKETSDNLPDLDDDCLDTEEECYKASYLIHKKRVEKVLHPYLEGLIETCTEAEEKKKDVSDGYTSKYFPR